jgi:hypothetical protein
VSDHELPIPLGPCSNGEYDPVPPSPVAREARRRALEACADGASRYGYPALTKELKAKVLGGNAARLYEIEPVPPRCDFTRQELATIRQELRDGDRLLGPATFVASADVREHHRLEVSTTLG